MTAQFGRLGLTRGESAAVLFFPVLLLVLAWFSRDVIIDPDTIAYLRAAHYYLEGRLDLAVTGSWGPMFSWLMVPVMAVVDRPVVAGRVAMAFSALVFLGATIALARVAGLDGRSRSVAAWLGLIFAAAWSADPIEPDLLFGGIVAIGFSMALAAPWLDSRRWQLCTGLVFGAAYLIKPVALPVAIVGVAAIAGLSWLTGKRSRRQMARSFVATAIGIFVLAGPWISVMMIKYGEFSPSARLNHAIVGPAQVGKTRLHPTFSEIHVPEEGRITTWEDLSVVPYPNWSPLDGPKQALHQIKLIFGNVRIMQVEFQKYDLFGIGIIALICGFLLHRPWRANLAAEPWRWLLVPVACFVGVYVPVYVGEPGRYMLPIRPYLIVASLAFLAQLVARGGGWLKWAACGLVAVSVGGPAMGMLAYRALFPGQLGYAREYATARTLATTFAAEGLRGPVVSISRDGPRDPAGIDAAQIGLFTAWLLHVPYYGDAANVGSLDDLAGARVVLADPKSASPTIERLSRSAAYGVLGVAPTRSADGDRALPVVIFVRRSP